MNLKTRTHGNPGFTLIEIMAVVLIIGMLSGIVGFAVFQQVDKARVVTAKTQISRLESSLELYNMDNARFPTSEQGLEALVSKPTVGRDAKKYRKRGYIDKIPLDPWGSPYVYLSPGVMGDFDIISLGADGVEGGAEYDADITNWD